jgi:hypothetical protein
VCVCVYVCLSIYVFALLGYVLYVFMMCVCLITAVCSTCLPVLCCSRCVFYRHTTRTFPLPKRPEGLPHVDLVLFICDLTSRLSYTTMLDAIRAADPDWVSSNRVAVVFSRGMHLAPPLTVMYRDTPHLH